MKVHPKTLFSKLIGLLLILIAVIGVLLSLAGVVAVWRVKDFMSAEIVSTMDDLIETLTYSEQSINTLSASLDAGLESINQLDTSLESARTTLDSTNHFFDTAAELTGKTLPDTFTSVQTAFSSASQSAKFVDDSLNFISSLPLIGGKYTPTVPLSEAMAKVAKDIEPLSGTFKGIEDDVLEVKGDMLTFQSQLSEAQTQIKRVQESGANARKGIAQTQGLIGKFSPRLKTWREKLPRWINLVTWGLSIYLVWVALAQVGLFIQGLSLMFSTGPAKSDEPSLQFLPAEETGGVFGEPGSLR